MPATGVMRCPASRLERINRVAKEDGPIAGEKTSMVGMDMVVRHGAAAGSQNPNCDGERSQGGDPPRPRS